MSTPNAARAVGCSYRQLDYAARLRGETPGSGHPRQWSPNEVIRLALAFHLAGTITDHARGPFPGLAQAALDVEADPPRVGYVILATATGALSWTDDPFQVLDLVVAQGSVVVARYDLADLLGDFLDADEIPR